MMPTLAEKWIEQGIEQGLQQGMQMGTQMGTQQGIQLGLQQGQQALRDSIVDLLSVRFDVVPVGQADQLAAIEEMERLRALLRQAATAESPAAFDHFLQRMKAEGGRQK